MNQKIRLRLAPSPTGFLHIGNLRTALFGYLLAKSMGGQFILRIEDTDEKREVAGAAESLVQILNWVGIGFDEGPQLGGAYGPYVQSERKEIYNQYVEELLAKGGAYRCFCSAERLTEMREQQQAEKLPPRYDRRCRELTADEVERRVAAGESFVVRQKLPLEGEVVVHDELRGDIKFNCADLEDQVLIKANGVPTYQFASVVDDHLMEISHVTRGDEWLPSFPKNVLLYKSFDWQVPVFIHLPLILNKTGGKLSKRQGDVFVEQYRERGYLPEALINFCALLGWHPKHDKEILSLTELEQEFAIAGMGASPAVFDEEKLDYYNGWYIRQKTDQELWELTKETWPAEAKPDYCLAALATVKERLKNLREVAELTKFYFEMVDYDASLLIWKSVPAAEIKANLQLLSEWLSGYKGQWSQVALETEIVGRLKAEDKKLGDYLWPLRVALTGQKASPSPFEVAGVLGREQSLARVEAAINKLTKL